MRRVIGAATPYRQGGSLRITLPKRLLRIYNLDRWQTPDLESSAFIFLETDSGILFAPLQDLLKNSQLKILLGA